MTNEELEQIKAANKLKTTTVTVAARVPQWLKGQVLQQADEAGTTVGEYIAVLLYSDSNGELVRSSDKTNEYRSEYHPEEDGSDEKDEKLQEQQNRINNLNEDIKNREQQIKEYEEHIRQVQEQNENLQNQLELLESQYKQLEGQYSQLDNDFNDLERQYYQLAERPTKEQYEQVEQQLTEWRIKAKQRQKIVQSLKMKMKEMQGFINFKLEGAFGSRPHQFVGGDELGRLEEGQVETIERRGPERADEPNIEDSSDNE